MNRGAMRVQNGPAIVRLGMEPHVGITVPWRAPLLKHIYVHEYTLRMPLRILSHLEILTEKCKIARRLGHRAFSSLNGTAPRPQNIVSKNEGGTKM